jgi:site-specific DNA recombinase
LKEQLLDLETESREQSALREALACLDSFTESIASNLESADWSTRREILRTLIDRVLIEPDQIRIVYRINFPLFVKQASVAGTEKVLHFCWSSVLRPAPTPPYMRLRIRRFDEGLKSEF